MRKRGLMRVFSIALLFIAVMLGIPSCARPEATAPAAPQPPPLQNPLIERVSTAVPFPRGLQLVDGELYVLARGRVRESGGVSGDIDDKAGTIYRVDPNIAEPITSYQISPAVRGNATVFAQPTSPPFILFDRTASPPTRDRETDRPYCSLRYDERTKSFYVCAFSGIDKSAEGQGSTFSKNTSDAIFRFDTRTKKWYEVERHSLEAGGNYPHHDPASRPPPHGRLNGPDNCLVVGRWLYCVAKDNSLLARYDLAAIAKNPNAGPPQSHWVLDDKIHIRGQGVQSLLGHSMLACNGDGYLYIGYRTSSAIVRIPLDADGLPKQPIVGEMLARFDPYDPQTRKSANLTDMVFGPDGSLYVVSAQPARIYRFMPDPENVFDGRTDESPPWADMSQLTFNPKMKSENVLVDARGRVYVTSGDAYDFQNGAGGVVYRITPQ